MKVLLTTLILFIFSRACVNALQINEILSNPIGDDGGREWVELYNDGDSDVDLSTINISIKGGNPVAVTPVSGGTILTPHGYAIVGSVVGGATKFALDYPTYSGPLLRASISLVNTGVTSIDVRVSGTALDSVASYTAAKEGRSYGRVGTSFTSMSPTPGMENSEDETEITTESTSTQNVGFQSTIPQMSPPSADVIVYLPQEKVVVAGAPTIFTVNALTGTGKQIDGMKYSWSFGDGGQGTGSSTIYRYFHPGRYVAFVDAANGLVAGKARMLVKVVPPEIDLSELKTSKYGPYVEIYNPNNYELDVSAWKLSINGALYTLPLTTVLLPGTTVISGAALGFSSSTVDSGSVVQLLFSNNEAVTRAPQLESIKETATTSSPQKVVSIPVPVKAIAIPKKAVVSKKATSSNFSATTTSLSAKKDTRIANFFRSFFK